MNYRQNMHIRSKWRKTNLLLRNKQFINYIPLTRRWGKSALHHMLDDYGMVYVKPDRGSSGRGVMKVEKIRRKDKLKYRYQLEKQIYVYSSFERFFASLQKQIKSTPYLIQKGVHLLRHQQRPFDIRVMVQINPKQKWEVTGIIARIAHTEKIVTNRKAGGDVAPLATLLRPYMKREEREQVIKQISSLCLGIAKELQKHRPNLKEIGADIGLDQRYKPWIIEVNTNPVIKLFNSLKDKSMFRKIVRYARAYGKKIKL